MIGNLNLTLPYLCTFHSPSSISYSLGSPFISTLSTLTNASLGLKIAFFWRRKDHQRGQDLATRVELKKEELEKYHPWNPLLNLSTQPSKKEIAYKVTSLVNFAHNVAYGWVSSLNVFEWVMGWFYDYYEAKPLHKFLEEGKKEGKIPLLSYSSRRGKWNCFGSSWCLCFLNWIRSLP